MNHDPLFSDILKIPFAIIRAIMGFNGALILMAFIFIASAILLAITNNPAFIAGIILSIVGVFALFIVDFDDEKYPSRKIQKQKRKASKKKKR